MTMTAAVSVSQQSAHVNQHDADKDLYFDWTCTKLLILYTSDFDVKPIEIISDATRPKEQPNQQRWFHIEGSWVSPS